MLLHQKGSLAEGLIIEFEAQFTRASPCEIAEIIKSSCDAFNRIN